VERKRHELFEPGLLLAGVLLTSVFALFLCSIETDLPLTLIRRFPLGLDFADFYRGAQHFLAGESLYIEKRFVTPPVAAVLFSPLTFFAQHTATVLFLFINIALVALGLVLLKKETGCSWLLVFAGLASCPALFLFERGNIDGIVFFLIVMTLVFWRRREGLIGCALMLAALLKLYPVLLFIPAIIERRWRMLRFAALSAIPWLLILHGDWIRFFTDRFFTRSSFFDHKENISLTNGIFFVRDIIATVMGWDFNRPINAGISSEYALPLWFFGVALFTLFYALIHSLQRLSDEQNLSIVRVLFVLPMYLYPVQVYQYTQVLSLIVLTFMWKTQRSGFFSLGSKLLGNTVLFFLALSCTYNHGFVETIGSRQFYGIVPFSNLLVFLSMLLLVSKKQLQLSKVDPELTSTSAPVY